MKLLIDNGADIHSPDQYKKNAVYFAAGNRNLDLMKLMIDKGANLNSLDDYKMTPAHYAAWLNENE